MHMRPVLSCACSYEDDRDEGEWVSAVLCSAVVFVHGLTLRGASGTTDSGPGAGSACSLLSRCARWCTLRHAPQLPSPAPPRPPGPQFLYTGSGGRDLSGNKRTNKEQSFDQVGGS